MLLEFTDSGFFEKLACFSRPQPVFESVEETVSRVLADVCERGDAAVLHYSRQFDKARLEAEDLRVAPSMLTEAAAALSVEDRTALDEAIRCVRDFHERTLPTSWEAPNPHGAFVGERFYPLNRVGVYIPGGGAPLVSTVVMTVVLAKLAGVPEIAVCTPPRADGEVNRALLAALHVCGVDEVYRIGGIQAIGALAYGTSVVPSVAKIFGPGNAYVIEAKRQVFGTVGIDLLPGPSELMVIADASANPDWVAADLLAQAEHGTGREKLYLATPHRPFLDAVDAALRVQLKTLRHAGTIERVLNHGFARIVTRMLSETAEVANFIAPEHLELHVGLNALDSLSCEITTAGAVFIGADSPTVLGDFTAGPSHTLPTGRTGRFFSGLQVRDFLRRTSTVRYTPQTLEKARGAVAAFSRLEGLDAHGGSLEIRFSESSKGVGL